MSDEPKDHGYMVRIPDRLWKAARQRAVREDLDMRAVILRLLERYIKKGLE